MPRYLINNIPDEGKGWTIIDALGGSGLLSHAAKQLKLTRPPYIFSHRRSLNLSDLLII